MSAVFENLRRDAGAWGAQVALDQLRSRIATSGMDAVRGRPALLAEVDQHAAAVRDALTEVTGRITAVGLAAYADGVSDAAAGHGWRLPVNPDGPEWSSPSWPLLRLLAVCVVAEAASLVV
ncbi:MAG TPA: DUF6401 family natural product biosynthesis protein [Planosporangium sp.]|jgi:hypothetical protein|nr:DUF6401 family natural product biosynthesis protein [Planosporangium sp.]